MRDCQHQTQITNNVELFSQSKQQQLRAASTTTLRPPRPRLDGPIMGPMVMAARLITTVDAGTAGVPYASWCGGEGGVHMLTRRQQWHAPWMRSHAEQRGVLWPGAHSSDGMCLAARQMPPSQTVWPACAGVSQKFPVRRPQSTQGRTRRASSPIANAPNRQHFHAYCNTGTVSMAAPLPRVCWTPHPATPRECVRWQPRYCE